MIAIDEFTDWIKRKYDLSRTDKDVPETKLLITRTDKESWPLAPI
jgi:hypothetical protein